MKVWIGCLAAYNSGRLHGKWFDLEDHPTAEDLQEVVNKTVLQTSPAPNVLVTVTTEDGTKEVPSSEEWFIADHEGFPEGSVGEYTSFGKLYEIRERIAEAEEEFGDDGQEILEAFEYCFGTNDTPISTIREAYRGKYDSCAAFSEEFAIETGGIKDDSPYFSFIDWEHVWKGQDQFSFSEHNGHFFWSSW